MNTQWILQNKFKKFKIVGNDAHVSNDLLNCYTVYKNDLEEPMFEVNKTHIKNIRKSQIINYWKKRNPIQIFKYSLLYTFGL